MKEFELANTSIPGEVVWNVADRYELTWLANRVPDFYRIIFTTIAEVLKFYKAKSTPRVGFVLKDTKGDFVMGSIMTFHKPEDGAEEDKGNWTLEFTLDEADMADLDKIVDNHSDIFVTCSGKQCQAIMGGRFKLLEYAHNLFTAHIDTLIKFLDANASETEEVSVVLRGVFTATVAVENGEKVIAIVPGEIIKQTIKDDSSL